MNRSRVAYLLSQAKESIDRGQRDEALDLIRQALEEDPGEMTITEVILSIERSGYSREPATAGSGGDTQPVEERNDTGTMDPKLEKAFRLSDESLAAGNEAKALAYLKKAVSLFPDEPEAAERLNSLKRRIQAHNLVKVGLKKLEQGDLAKAVAASRKAFEIMPDAQGLDDLLNRIESNRENTDSRIQDDPDTEFESDLDIDDVEEETESRQEPEEETIEESSSALPAAEAMLWADRIRAAVKEDRFEEAGKMVAEAVRNHPDDPLLDSFHTKLKRLGFVN